ncbi:MAG: SpoIIE family protein phosphatase [Thermoguttaceae bacterium]|nr:SpoIIE family protein phosphatase [Thermoguttaceae bacterium]
MYPGSGVRLVPDPGRAIPTVHPKTSNRPPGQAKPMIHKYSLFTYLLLIILLSSSLVIGVVIFGNRNLMSDLILGHQTETFKLMTQAASDEIEIRLTNVEEVVQRNANLFRDQEPHSRQEVTKILEQTLAAFPTVFAMEIIFTETEAEQIEKAGFTALYAYRHSQNLLNPETKKREEIEEELASFEIEDRNDPSKDYIAEWYVKPLVLGEATWTSPYYDPQVNVLMITYSVPVFDRPDHIEAIVTADVSLEWLDQLIDTFEISKSGEPILITPEQIIYRSENKPNPEPSLIDIAKAQDDIEKLIQSKDPNGDKNANIFELVKQGNSGEIKFTNPYTDEKTYLYFATLPKISWKLGCFVLEKDLLSTVNSTTKMIIGIGLSGVLLLIIPSFMIARSVSRPLSILSSSARNVAQGHFDSPLPKIQGKGEIPQLFHAFDAMRSELKKYVSDIAESAAREANMHSQLQIAHSIQQGMVPKDFEPARKARLDIFAQMTPAQEVGGDLYDYQVLDDGKIYFGLGDVSGKGVPASIFMAMGKTLIHSAIQRGDNPAAALNWVNRQLISGNEAGLFITALCGVYDPDKHEITVCCAGHNPPYIREADGHVWKVEITNGKFPLAIADDVEYENFTIPLPAGSVFFIYSDGVTDAVNPAGEYFGEQNLEKALAQAPCSPTQGLAESVMAEIKNFAAGAKQSDDITMLAFKEIV